MDHHASALPRKRSANLPTNGNKRNKPTVQENTTSKVVPTPSSSAVCSSEAPRASSSLLAFKDASAEEKSSGPQPNNTNEHNYASALQLLNEQHRQAPKMYDTTGSSLQTSSSSCSNPDQLYALRDQWLTRSLLHAIATRQQEQLQQQHVSSLLLSQYLPAARPTALLYPQPQNHLLPAVLDYHLNLQQQQLQNSSGSLPDPLLQHQLPLLKNNPGSFGAAATTIAGFRGGALSSVGELLLLAAQQQQQQQQQTFPGQINNYYTAGGILGAVHPISLDEATLQIIVSQQISALRMAEDGMSSSTALQIIGTGSQTQQHQNSNYAAIPSRGEVGGTTSNDDLQQLLLLGQGSEAQSSGPTANPMACVGGGNTDQQMEQALLVNLLRANSHNNSNASQKHSALMSSTTTPSLTTESQLAAMQMLQQQLLPGGLAPTNPVPVSHEQQATTNDNMTLIESVLLRSSSQATASRSASAAAAPTTTVAMEVATDTEQLSRYQVLVRRQLEYFVSQQDDAEYSVQGRKKQARLGQVGIRCQHCSHLPHRLRGRGSGYYPAKLAGVYQAAQNMATNHLNQFCNSIPLDIRQELLSLRGIRHDSASGGGKKYWADACRTIGLVENEEEECLRFSSPRPSWNTKRWNGL